MGTLFLFLVSVLSLLFFNPIVTSYVYSDPSWLWKFVTAFTYAVSHGNWEHLIGNFLFGAPFMLYLEHKLKSTKTFVRLFFCLGFVSLLGQMLLNSISLFPSLGIIGSSGAIFGLVGATLFMYDGPKILKIVAKLIACFYVYTQAQFAYVSIFLPLGVAYGAHLAGLLAGILFSLRHHPDRRRHR